MGFNIAGGVAAALGYQKGQDEALARTNAADDRQDMVKQRAYRDGQQAYQAGQQTRQVAEQGRADALRSDLSAIKDTATTDFGANAPKVDDDGNAMPAAVKTEKVLGDVQMRQAAAAYGKAGDFGKALELHGQADKIGWDRSAKSFQELSAEAAAPTVTALDVANKAAEIYGKDPFAGKVTNVRDDGNGGVIMDAVNRETGVATTKKFANKAELLESLHGYYSPTTYAALAQKRAESLIKVNEKLLEKPVTTVPGGYIDNKTGKFKPTMVGSDTGMVDGDGNPIYSSRGVPGAGGGAGGKGAGGKGPKDTADLTNDTLQEMTKLKSSEITEDQFLAAKDHAGRINSLNPNVPPAMAARIAVAVAKDPTKLVPAINPDTGKIDRVVKDGANGVVTFNRGIGDADNIGDITPEQMKVMTTDMIQKLPPNRRPEFIRAAREPEYRKKMEENLRSDAASALEQASAGKTPEQQAAAAAAVKQALDSRLLAIGGNLDLISKFGPPSKEEKKADSVKWFGGGAQGGEKYAPPAGSPAAQAQARQEAARATAAAKTAAATASQDALSAQYQADKRTMKPLDLLTKYDPLRGKLPVKDAADLRAVEQKI